MPWKLEKINFKPQRNIANTGKISPSVSCHQYFVWNSSVSHEASKFVLDIRPFVRSDFL